jgi:glyoxylase-like metal-dependent hydrolase (beta-lactamase superfamily II)
MKIPKQICGCLIAAFACMAAAAQDEATAGIVTVRVTDGIYMLMGLGGNVAVSVGEDGVFIIDDQMPPLSQQVRASIAELTDQPVRIVFNTHWHFDHTGGNPLFREAGSVIMAHDNVRRRMSTAQFSTLMGKARPPSPQAALPVVTFDTEVSLHLNGDTIRAFHVPPAHTDGDTILLFEDSNVVHMGDTYFNGMYPTIDVDAGGSIRGLSRAIDLALERLNSETKVIPGHGPLSDIDGVIRYQVMLNTVADRVQRMIDQGRSLEDIVQARPTIEFDQDWTWGNFSAERWVRLVYDSLVRNPAKPDSG